MMGNSPLELHSADSANFGHSQTISLVSRPKFAESYESQTENPSVVVAFSHESKKNKIKSLLKFLLRLAFAKSRIHLHLAIARFGNAESWQSKQNKCASAQPNLARFVVQKIRFKDAVVPSADFLLESDKRGSPPKSEKRQLLETQFKRIGGSGAGGAALLQKETSESKKQSVDCHDSATNLTQSFRHTERSEVSKSSVSNQMQNTMTQERMSKSHRFTQSKKIVGDSNVAKMDSSPMAQNDESSVDCFGDELPRNDKLPTTPSLRGRIVDSHEAIQKNNIDCHESALPNLAMTFLKTQNLPQRLNFAL